jgi:hypothetical protein
MTTVLNHRQVVSLIKAVGHKRTVIVQGEMGSGKTAMQTEFRNDPFFSDYLVPAPIECTQLSEGDLGLPDLDRDMGVSRTLPHVRFGVHKGNQKGVNGSKPIIMCFDEVGKIPQRVVNMIAAPLYERRYGEYAMPEGSITYGCTNLTGEGLGDNLPAHIRNRIVVVTMRKPTQKEWVQDFALPAGLAPEIIAATEMYPQVFDSFMDYAAGGKFAGKALSKENPYISNPQDAGQEQVVTPRSLHAASDIVASLRDTSCDDVTLQAALEGTVGAPFATQLTSFIRFGRDIPAFARVVADPLGTPLSNNPTAQIVQVFQFITQTANGEQANAVTEYVTRMKGEMQALFINSVANSTRIALFGTCKKFGVMLAANRALFS